VNFVDVVLTYLVLLAETADMASLDVIRNYALVLEFGAADTIAGSVGNQT
jgi:hypothetical protein